MAFLGVFSEKARKEPLGAAAAITHQIIMHLFECVQLIDQLRMQNTAMEEGAFSSFSKVREAKPQCQIMARKSPSCIQNLTRLKSEYEEY